MPDETRRHYNTQNRLDLAPVALHPTTESRGFAENEKTQLRHMWS